MVTNFYQIKIDSESFNIQCLPYSDALFGELKARHNPDASFFRHGDIMYISPRRGADLSLGKFVELEVAKDPKVVLSLIRHLVFRMFREAIPDRVPESFCPLRFYSERKEHEPLTPHLPPELKGRIGFPRVMEVDTRQIEVGGKPVFGLLIGSRQRWRCRLDLQTLSEWGFPLVGRTVMESVPIPGLEHVLTPDENLLGEVVSIDGPSATLVTNNGTITRPLADLYLQRTRHQLGDFLAFKLGSGKAESLLRLADEDRKKREHHSYIVGEIASVANWFARTKGTDRVYANQDGFSFTVSTSSSLDNASVQLQRTSLIFDYGPGASSSTPLSGLKTFGPFNSARFEHNNLKVLAIFRQHNRGAATQFVKALVDGVPESKHFQQGLKGLFRLHSVDYVLKPLNAGFPEDYETAIDEAVTQNDSKPFDIALVECPTSARLLPHSQNPYYRARVRLMSYGIPVQGVKDEHLCSGPTGLQWTLGPMALQIYAKVGGTPWRLPSTQSVDREIIVGVGNAIERQNFWADAEQSRIVGITTFFLGDGRYVQGERLRSVPYSEYFNELLNALSEALVKIAREYAWQNGETVRLVFHIFKPLKNLEADVVSKLVEQFPQFKILFAFVTISTEHPWMMYRSSSDDREGGVALCERGDNLILDSHSCLLQLRGNQDRPNKRQRAPSAVLVRLHEKSTYTDLRFIAQQIHDFAFLSWRSFYPNETPVTVFYSNLLASATSRLGHIEGWNSSFVDTHFRRKLWFL